MAPLLLNMNSYAIQLYYLRQYMFCNIFLDSNGVVLFALLHIIIHFWSNSLNCIKSIVCFTKQDHLIYKNLRLHKLLVILILQQYKPGYRYKILSSHIHNWDGSRTLVQRAVHPDTRNPASNAEIWLAAVDGHWLAPGLRHAVVTGAVFLYWLLSHCCNRRIDEHHCLAL